jgi:glucosamine-6-phosphate deaminase
MHLIISNNASELGREAAKFTAARLNENIRLNGEARLVVSTGSSQFETFQALLKEDIDWSRIEVFHLDEYIGIPITHKASFRKYLNDRFINLTRVKKFHCVDTEKNINDSIKTLTFEIKRKPLDIGLIGIGVNAHIAFNDPPADFETHESYIVVTLDTQCKLQQVNEGWFRSVEEVPKKAVSMSVWQIMQCRTIISCVPHMVKADAVSKTFKSRLTNTVPATILKQHNDFHLYLDKDSASKIINL